MLKPFATKSFKTAAMPTFGKILLIFISSASLASADVLLLTGGDPTDGLALNPANVVDAIYSPYATDSGYLSSYNGSYPVTFQGVAFPSTNSNISGVPGYLYHSNVSEGFGGPDTAVNADFATPGSPSIQDTNLLNLVNAGLAFNSGSFTLTINNLNPNTSYRIDSIVSLDGWPDSRTDIVTYNGLVTDTLTLAPTGTTIHNIYDVKNTVAANNLGQIQLTFSGDQGGFYSGLVVSSLVVPEPSTWAMMFAGLAFLGFCIPRKSGTFQA